jgi:hypothetical protein
LIGVNSACLQSGHVIANSFTISSNLFDSVLSHAYSAGSSTHDSIFTSTSLSALHLDLHHLQSIKGSAKPQICPLASQTFGFIMIDASISMLSVLFWINSLSHKFFTFSLSKLQYGP